MMPNQDNEPIESFEQLGVDEPLLKAIRDLGYEAPTPIQSRAIPLLLEGRDVIGQAQTGTGKTAAFAIPILQRLDPSRREVQALVLTPTRELAIQVAEAIHTYGKYVAPVHVLPVYGGQSITTQLRRLEQGVNVVVGTPGRIMDHLRRGTLQFDALNFVVLDEADEMLRMGFIEDVEWILAQAPEDRKIQAALFSATMPAEIRRIAERYLDDPITVSIAQKTLTVPTIEQRYIQVSERHKLDALTRILEVEAPEAVLIFSRTKVGAAELTEKLQARGYAAEPMHGDMSQRERESVINRLRRGQSEIVVATDVAARGWDVEQISHVINYDIPYDTESYVHRIGRTGRAGREGVAILFVTPRQQRMLRDIERYTGKRIEAMKMPSQADVASRRMALFKEEILTTLQEQEKELEPYLMLVEELAEESGCDMAEIAAAAARMARGDKPLAVALEPEPEQMPPSEDGMVRLFIDAGRRNGVRPSDIVGAIANEADIPGKSIGAIDIFDRFTFVDVPARYVDQVLERMARTTIRHREAVVRRATPRDQAPEEESSSQKPRRKGKRAFNKGGKKYYRKG